jgi:hypothetical protein
MEQPTENLLDLQIDPESNSYLSEAAKWSKFLAIMGFIMCGLLVILGLFSASIYGSASHAIGGAFSEMGGFMIAAFYFVFAVVYFFPCLYLLRFSSKMQAALRSNNQQELNNSFSNLKSCFRFMGILTIVVISLYVIVILLLVVSRFR